MLQNEPQFVFLDAAVFVGAGYNMLSRDLNALGHLCVHGTTRILTTDVIVREVRAGIHREVRDAVAMHEKFWRGPAVRVLKAAGTFGHRPDRVEPENVAAEICTRFDDYLKSTKAEVLPAADLIAGPVFDAYFRQSPPFGPGKKRREFPDAFSVAAVRKWLEENATETVVAVSPDRLLGDAIGELPRVTWIEKLSAFFDVVNSDDGARARFLKHETIKHRDDVRARAAKAFEWLGFDVQDRWEGEVVEARAQMIHLADEPSEYDVVHVEASEATLVTRVDVEFEADLHYGDENAASYDHEDGYLFWNYIDEAVRGEATDLELEVSVSFAGLEPSGFRLVDVRLPGIETIWVRTSRDRE